MNTEKYSRQYSKDRATARKQAEAIHVGALVKVLAFYPDTMTVDVKPISQRLTHGEYATPSQVLGVPVAVTRGGKFLFRPWYNPGDIGVVLYLDHDLDLPLEKGAECKPNTERSHSETDAVFVGGVIAGGWKAPANLPEGHALATESGSIYMVMTQEKILIQGDIDIEGDVSIVGDVSVQGNITVTGGDVVADGVSLKHHVHLDVVSGGDLSGEPRQ